MEDAGSSLNEGLHKEFWAFFKHILNYLGKRLRIFAVLAVVFVEVARLGIEGLKRHVLRYMFWGRGLAYRWAIASVAILVLIVMPLTAARTPVTQEAFAEEDYYDMVAQTDLLIEQGSVKTLVPKGRPRTWSVKYVVQGGDTLAKIARQFDLRNVETLLWANHLANANLIRPGQVLVIPPGDGLFHKVKKGETLASVAKKYKASEQSIADVNWLEPPFKLKVGSTVFVPEGTMPQAPRPVVAARRSSGGGGGGYVAPPSGRRFLAWPVAGGRGYVSQCPSRWHIGVDIADPGLPNIIAAAGGKVIYAGWDSSGYAWSVQIDHGNGYTTWYAHLSKISVSRGQYVGRGRVIGRMGRSGNATGVHLHFEVRRGTSWASRISPTPFINDSRVYGRCRW